MNAAAPSIAGGASASPTALGRVYDLQHYQRSRHPATNLDAALRLARAGVAVFPCAPSKEPLVRWREASTDDPAAVERLWARHPGALVGVDCGKSNVVVIDADRHGGPDGVEVLSQIVGSDLSALDAPIVETPTGNGLHIYFKQPNGERLGNARGGLPPGVDVRGDGGFVIAGHSRRADGSGWRVSDGARDLVEVLAMGDLPPLPDALLRLIRAKPERPEPRAPALTPSLPTGGAGERERAFARAALDACAGELASTGAGGRNEALNGAAFRMGRQIGAGRIGRGEVERALEDAAQACGLVRDDGWPSVRASLRSGLDAGAAQPADALVDREGWDAQFAAYATLGTATARALAGDAPVPPRATMLVDGVKIDAETGEVLDEAHAAADAPAQAQRPPVVELQTVNAASFSGQPVPRQRWLIEGLIPSANVGIIAGDGAVGKSLLALQLCVAVALGGEWIGFRPAGGRALYVSCEDEEPELHRRLHRLCPDLAALANLDLIDLAGKDAVLAAPDRAGLLKPTRLYAAIRHVIATRRPSLIVLDNLSDTFGGDEVKRVHARQFIALMRALALEFDTTVLILQHPSQSGLASGSGTSGSTGWSNGVRTRLFLERRLVREGNAQVEADRDIRVMSMKKANRSPLGDQIVIRWEDGRFIREERRSFNLRDAAQHAERTFVKLLLLHAAQGRNLSAHKCSTYAPAVFERHPGADGVSGSAFALAMERLLEAGTIAVEEVGSPSKRRQRLVVIAEGEPETFATSDEDGAPSGDAR